MVTVNQITPKNMPAKRYIVSLTEQERIMLEKLISTGKTSARKINPTFRTSQSIMMKASKPINLF